MSRARFISRPTLLPLVALGSLTAVCVAITTATTGDYNAHGAVAGDNAGPALAALSHGDISAFIALQPLMGLTSLLLRLPFVWIGALLHSSALDIFRAGAAACLLPAGALCAWIVAKRTRSRIGATAAVVAAALILCSPSTRDAVAIGHPEEVLAATLTTGAVLAAAADLDLAAGLLLGLAVGTKQWALLGAVPVLIASSAPRIRMIVVAGATGLLLTASAPLADPGAFSRASAGVGGGHIADPFSIWWGFGSPSRVGAGAGAPVTAHTLPFGLTRTDASAVTLAIGLAALALAGARRRIWKGPADALALLALLGLIRCLADPVPLQYNFVEVIIPLAVWEVIARRRLPLAAALAVCAAWLTAGGALHADWRLVNALSVSWVILMAAYLAYSVFYARAPEARKPRESEGRNPPSRLADLNARRPVADTGFWDFSNSTTRM